MYVDESHSINLSTHLTEEPFFEGVTYLVYDMQNNLTRHADIIIGKLIERCHHQYIIFSVALTKWNFLPQTTYSGLSPSSKVSLVPPMKRFVFLNIILLFLKFNEVYSGRQSEKHAGVM